MDAGGDAIALAPVDQGCNGVPAVSGDGSTISFRNRANTGWHTVSPSGGALSETIPLPVPTHEVSEAVLSSDGAKLAFHSGATNLVAGDTNSRVDVFAVPRGGGSAARLSVDSDGRQTGSGSGSDSASIAASGEQIAFHSSAGDLVGGDTNNTTDVFVRSEVPEYLTMAQVRAQSGFLGNSAYASDPVNTATGNFTDTWMDMSFPGVFGLDVTRTYNSREPDTGALGRGWSSTFATRVSELSGGDVQVVQDSGRVVVFRADGPGRWLAPEQLWATLIADGDGSYSLRHDDGRVEDFGADGRLASLSNWDGQSVTLARNPVGTVATATSSTGASVTFSYDATSGRLTEATAGDGRRVSYAYGPGDTPALASVTLPDGRTQSYAADAGGRVTAVRDGAGTLLVASAYDPLGRVLSQTTPDGGTVSFAYDQKTRTTTVRDSASGDVTRYVHDPEGRIARMVDATGESLVRGYDAGGAGNLTSVTDRSGTAVGQEFTPERLLSSRTLAGVNADGSDRRREYAYDAARRVVSVTEKAPGGTDVVTTLTYTGTNRVPATVAGPAPAGHPTPPLTAIESEAGLVTRITDPDGVVTADTWDPVTRRRSSQTVAPGTPQASTTTFTYTVEGWLASATTSLGHVSSYTYDSVGRLTVRRDPDGAEWRTTYDDAGRPVAEIDPLGHAATYRYDVASGRLVEEVDRRGKSTRYRYNSAGDLIEVIAPDDDADAANDPTTRYTYGPLARLESVTDPAGVVTRYSYDGDGRVTALSDGAGHAWRTTYWPDGQVRSQSHPEAGAGQETKSFYDPLGRLAQVVDPTGAETSYAYDAGGRPVRTEGPRSGQVEVRTYTPAGRLEVVTDAVGAVTRYVYDAAGRAVSVTDADGTPHAAATRSTYDGAGRVVASTSAAGLTTTFTYDRAGRVVTETAPGGRVTRRAWTPRGELASETDPGGGVVSYSYDLAGNLTGVTDALGNPTAYGYDARGNRISRSDALGGVETWAYDAADRPTSHRGPLGHVLATRAYDPLGRLATTTDASGRTENRIYDRAGRLVRQSWANGAETLVRTRAWDPAGRLIGVTGPGGTTTYSHDDGSNVVSVDAPGTERDLSYAWDLAGRRSAVTHPDGAVVRSTYDPLGRLATVAHPTLGTTTYAWDPDGRLRSEDLPGDGNDRTWAYDPATGLAARYTQHLAGATLDTALAHDRAGRLVSAATAGAESQSYRYDAGGQLLAVTTNGASSHAYEYDALGRRTGSTDPAGAFDYAYDAGGRLLARTTPDADYPLSVKAQINGQTVGTLAGHRPGDATYAYDPDGRRTARTGPEGTTTYAYGPDGRLATTVAGAVTTRASYDAAGRLGAVAVDDATPDTTRVVWDDSPVPQPLELSDARGRVELVRGAGLIGITTDAGPALVSADHLGSALATPATASVVGAGSYGPFGDPGTPLPAEPTVGYRGELQVDGLLHLRARDYDATTGAFTTPDPLDGVDGTPTVSNTYHYADNDPTNKTDPLGLRATDDDFMACAATSPLDGWDISNPDAGLFERNRGEQVLARRTGIERWATTNGISSFLVATLVHHEGGNYLDPLRHGAAQGFDYAKLGADKAGLGSASVGIGQVQLGTARQVLAERYCGEPDWSDLELGSAMIESDDFSISMAAGYLRLLKNDYPTASDRALFMAYAGSPTVNRIMEHFGWDVKRLANAAVPHFYVEGRFSVVVDGEPLGMSVSTLAMLLRREDHWESSSKAMRRAGW